MTCRALSIAVLLLFGDAHGAAFARGNVLDVAIGPTSGVSLVRCPFDFHQAMPPGAFCVYEGIALGADGQPCKEPVVVIWARLAPEPDAEGGLGEDVTDPADVLFGFVAFPDLVMRAATDDGAERRATILDYAIGDDQPPVELRGSAEVRFVPAASGGGIEVLGLRIDGPVLASETCAFTSYDGTFLGVMTAR